MLPLAAAIALALALSGWWRGCAAWAFAVVGVLGTMAVLKFVFFTCSRLLGDTGIHSPSGHTASAAVIMGGALLLFLRGRLPGLILALIPLSLAILFGITRLAVHAHSLPEVIVGGCIGLIGAAVLAVLAGPRPAMPSWPAAFAAVAILVSLHGLRLHAESTLHSLTFFPWLPLPAMCRA